jgi:hypothetical protein
MLVPQDRDQSLARLTSYYDIVLNDVGTGEYEKVACQLDGVLF